MNIYRKILLLSILVAWTSVIFKYKTSAFLSSRRNENEEDQQQSRRIRQSLRDAYHRVVDPKSKDDESTSGGGGTGGGASSFRVRQTIRDQYHKIVDGKGGNNNRQADSNKAETKKPGVKSNNNNELRDSSSDQKSRIKKAQSHEIFESLARRILSSSQSSHKKYNNHNYNDGYYNNYNYRPGKYGEVRGTLCTNYLEYDGIVFGQFYCPIEGFEYDETMCCGALKEQYCCSLAEYNQLLKGSSAYGVDPATLEQKRITRDNILFFMIIAVPIVFMTFLLVGFLVYFLIVRKGRRDDPLPIYSSQIDNKDAYDEYDDDDDDEEEDVEQVEVEDDLDRMSLSGGGGGDQSKTSQELKLK